MKISLLTIPLLFFAFSIQAQLQELNWSCSPYNVNDCSAILNVPTQCIPGIATRDDWKVSHGSPGVTTISSKWAVLRAKEVAGVWTGEGIFIPYTFQQGRRYQLEISAQRSDNQDGGRLRLKAANNLSVGGIASCQEAALPSNQTNADVYVLGRAQGINDNKRTFTSPIFEPAQNFSQFWMYAEEIYQGRNCEFLIEYVAITDLGPEPTDPPDDEGCQYVPTTPINLKVSNIENGSFRLSWDPSSYHYGNSRIDVYNVYYGTSLYRFAHTDGETYIDLPIRCASTYYSVKARADVECFSGRSELIYIEANTSFTLNTDVTGQKKKNVLATSSITLTSGFQFKALTSDYFFNAAVDVCTASPAGRVSSPESQYIETDTLEFETGDPFPEEEDTTTAIRKSDDEIAIYPNPSHGMVNIAIVSYTGKFRAKVFTVTGLQLLEKEMNAGSSDQPLDLSFLDDGIYIIKVETDNKVYVKTVILN